MNEKNMSDEGDTNLEGTQHLVCKDINRILSSLFQI